MTLDGETHRLVQDWLRVVQTMMDAVGRTLGEALEQVPPELRAAVEAALASRDEEARFARPGATIRSGGPRLWFASWEPARGFYWPRLRSYLIDRRGRSLQQVESIDIASDNVLQYLEDPRGGDRAPSQFRGQGLVLGYVQSGKTANFTALIAKAADIGYRLVIVLSGINNDLRAQTQRRLDLELGLIDDPKGVGRPGGTHAWWQLTNSSLGGDFKPNTDAGPLHQGSRGIMVIKKNATVLKRVNEWLEGRDLADLPVLVIDDEADQASINTARLEGVDLGPDTGDVADDQELDPSRINGLIRDLVGKFRRVSYVAYTATPFANVLIDPDVDGQRWGSDLFPNDFIVSLPRSEAYVGAERIFGRPALESEDTAPVGLDIVRIVPDHEIPALIPRGQAAASWGAEVTPSLELALIDWVLATAAKTRRLGDGISSMLIHTSPRVAQQNQLAAVVDEAVRAMRNSWRYDPALIRARLIDRWDTTFRPVTVGLNADLDIAFSAIEPQLGELFRSPDGIRVLVLNNSSIDLLDYEADPTLKVILIGGNRLSRGLTLEDLTVSFYVRESPNYDTLLQMGRWFGYRAAYIDLTRLWTTDQLVANFRHLSLVEEDLRDQINVYERERLTPRNVAPRIRAHPAMLVTARNRMGTAERVRQSYTGQLLQTVRFRLGDDAWLQANLDHTRELLAALGEPTGTPHDDRPGWGDIPFDYVHGYLTRYRSAQDTMSFDADTAARYIRTQAERHGELTTWTVAVRSGSPDPDLGGAWDLGIAGGSSVGAITRSRLAGAAAANSIGVLTSPPRRDNLKVGDEAADLTADQLDHAAELLTDPTVQPGWAIRAARPATNGLLLIYPISPFSQARSGSTGRINLFDEPNGRPLVIGVALSFPRSDTGATVEYVAGRPSSDATSRPYDA